MDSKKFQMVNSVYFWLPKGRFRRSFEIFRAQTSESVSLEPLLPAFAAPGGSKAQIWHPWHLLPMRRRLQ